MPRSLYRFLIIAPALDRRSMLAVGPMVAAGLLLGKQPAAHAAEPNVLLDSRTPMSALDGKDYGKARLR